MIPSSKSRDTKTEALERTPPDPLAIHQATEDTKLGIRKGTGTTSDNLGFWQLYEPGRWSWLPSSGYMVIIWLLYVIIWLMIVNKNLVGGFCDSFNHLEKYEFVNGKDDIPYRNGK
jgi:hypothetical protein